MWFIVPNLVLLLVCGSDCAEIFIVCICVAITVWHALACPCMFMSLLSMDWDAGTSF